MSSADRSPREHWDEVYTAKLDAELSWFQPHPARSLSLISGLDPRPRRVIDVGGGQSVLALELLHLGIPHVTVLDISERAIARARERCGPQGERVQWIVADVLEVRDIGSFDLWHDRAVFHFLTRDEDRRRYRDAAVRSIDPGGHLLLATFAATGPERCSGLPVCRYGAARLAAEFAPEFRPVAEAEETHQTPWGRDQDFLYLLLKRTDA